ncbi:MAG: LysM peptidoglycan-binding domain-containing protein [Anaerolineales bacterium]|nr:LysM peptidoglycan-binding domain-containing protein [Anaerolineales bacterium]
MKKATQKSILILLALIVALSGFGFTTQPAKSTKCAYYHTVWYGETLYKIGLRYGMTWDKISKANNIKNPGKIYAGEVLCIPAVATKYGTGGPYNYQNYYGYNYYGYGGPYNYYNYYGYGGPYTSYSNYGTNYAYYYGAPYITVVSVNEGKTVTIKGYNFPKKSKLIIYLNNYGAGSTGKKVGTITTGKKTTFTATFDIPSGLKKKDMLSITVKNKSTGAYAYSWFYN